MTLTANDGGHTGTGGGTDVVLGTVNVDVKEPGSLIVTTLNDVVDAFDGKTSLREAVAYANAHAGADTVTFASNLHGTIRLDAGDGPGVFGGTLAVTEALTIDGGGRILISGDVAHNDATLAGTDITDLVNTSVADLSDNVRLFDTSTDLTLKGLTLTGGHTTATNGSGGAVRAAVQKTVAIESSTISGNSTEGQSAFGGALYGSTINVIGSTLSDNHSGAGGGAIAGSSLTLTDSTVSGNSSVSYGGGLTGSGVTLTNSTVTGNSTTGAGGAGGGVYLETGTVTNSIILGNVAKNADGDEIVYTYAKVGGNIIGRDGGGGADVFSGSNDVGDTTAAAVFAHTVDIGNGVLAGVLANNGGPVQTVALNASATNPALDASDASAPATDARGMATVDQAGIANTNDSARDLGAYEANTLADAMPPTITINSIAGDNVVNAAEGAATITVSGTAVGAEDGQIVTLSLKTADGSATLQTLTTTVSGGAWHLDLPPSATPMFPDGNYLVTADVSDAAGNPAVEATRTITVDTHAPTIIINPIAGDNVVNAAEGTAAITVSGTATGAEDGQRVTLALKTPDGSTTLQTLTTTVSGGAWHIDLPPGATPAFPDGNYLITADVSDTAGNPATEATRVIHVDVRAPTVTINAIAGDDVVNGAEGAGTVTISGIAVGAENGQTVTLALKTPDGSATLQTLTTTVSDGAWHLDLPPGATPAFPDGNYLVTADVADAAGNSATESTRTIRVDTHAPTVTINPIAGDNVVNAAEGAATITVSGAAAGAEDGQIVTLALNTADGSSTLQTLTTVVSDGAWHLDLPPGATPSFPDGNYLVTADVSDAAGNPATESMRTIRVDTHAPTVTINTIAGDNTVNAAEGAATITVSGGAAGAEDGQVVTLTLKTADGSTTLQTLAATVSGGAWHVDLPPGATPAFSDGQYLVTADVSDAAGNPATEATRAITVDTHAPAAPTFALTSDTGVSATDHITNNSAITYTPAEAGGTLLYAADGAGFSVIAPTFTADGAHTVLVAQQDAAGNIGAAGSLTFTFDTTAPAAPTVTLADNSVVSYTPAEAGGMLFYKADGAADFTIAQPTFNGGGTHTVVVEQQDIAGNIGAPGSLTFTLDDPGFAPPHLTGFTASSVSGNFAPGSAPSFKPAFSEATTAGVVPNLGLGDSFKLLFDALSFGADAVPGSVYSNSPYTVGHGGDGGGFSFPTAPSSQPSQFGLANFSFDAPLVAENQTDFLSPPVFSSLGVQMLSPPTVDSNHAVSDFHLM